MKIDVTSRTGALVMTIALAVALPVLAVGETLSLVKNHQAIKTIQDSRVQITFDNCVDQNQRHDAGVVKAGQLGFQGRSAVRSLIDVMLPMQDCSALVARRFHVTYPKGGLWPSAKSR